MTCPGLIVVEAHNVFSSYTISSGDRNPRLQGAQDAGLVPGELRSQTLPAEEQDR